MKTNTKIDKKTEKILVIGANGFLGSCLMNYKYLSTFQLRGVSLIAGDLNYSHLSQNILFYKIDITNAKKIERKILEIDPQVIILSASMTDVDQCEIDKNLATKINIEGPKNVIKVCKKIASKLVFLSTDFIFDGTKENGLYKEKDIPNPLNHYAKTKYEAEKLIRNSELNYLICRTSVLYGWNKWKLNFVTWIIEQLKQNKNISIVMNQINSPTYTENLAQIIFKLIEKEAKGVYHTAGDCVLSRYEIALKTAEIFGYNRNLIKPITNLKQKAIRPENVSLDITKLKSIIGSELKILNLEEGLCRMNEERNNKK